MTPVTLPPLTIATNSAAAPVLALARLQPGAVLDALVLAKVDDTTLRLLLASGTLDLKTDLPLAPGTRVALSIEGTPSQPQLILRPLPELPGQPAPQGALRGPATLPPSPAAAPVAAGEAGEAILTSAAALVGNTVARQGGVAPQRTLQAPATLPTPPMPPDASASDASAIETAAAVETIVKSAAALVGNATARQGGLAPLYANLQSALARPDLPIPQPVAAAVRQLLSLRLGIDAGNIEGGNVEGGGEVAAADIKTALLRSGLVADPVGSNGVRPTAGPPDLRTALLGLRAALKDWVDTEPLAQKEAAQPGPARSEPQAATRAPAPMPPFRNVPTLAQAPALPTIPADAPPADIVRHLIDETDAAIARQTLLQIASLPDDQGAGMRARDDKPLHLTFDIPLLTAQGTAIAQLRIERDGAERSRDGAQPVWKVSFSIDVEPIGPVHARIGLVGDRASVTLKAERRESVDRLARELPSLEASLRDAALEPGRLLCHAGAPSAPAADPGRFLDHVS